MSVLAYRWKRGPRRIWGTLLALTVVAVMTLGQMAEAAEARPMRFARLSQDQGLSQNTVIAILQDSTGYIWLGTENGLNRYDGHDVRRYARTPGQPGALLSDFVFGLEEDAQGNIWVATDGGGLAKWVRASDSFTSFRHDPAGETSLASNALRSLAMDAKGRFWLGHLRAGLDVFDPKLGVIAHFGHDPADPASLSSDEIYALAFDRMGKLWVGTENGLNRLDPETGEVQRFLHDANDPYGLSGPRVRAIFEDSQGILWVGTRAGGLNRFDRETGRFQRYAHDPDNPASLGHNRVRAIFEDADGRMWVGHGGGLDLLDRASGSFAHYRNDPADATSLADSHVMALYQDRSGVLWVGTKAGGVSTWNPRTWSLGHFGAEGDGLSESYIDSFAELPGSDLLWVATFGGGINAVDLGQGTVTQYRSDNSGLSDDRVMSLLGTKSGELWGGTMAGGLNRFDPQADSWRVYRNDPADPASLSADGIMSLLEDRDGRLWVGTFGGGLNRYDAATDSFVHFPYEPGNPRALSSPRATALAQDPSGRIWVGTDGGGLNLLDPATGEFRHFRHEPGNVSSLSDDTVYALHVDPSGGVWVGTRGGLNKILTSPRRPGEFRFTSYTREAGLPNNVIYGIRSDDHGYLWLSTNFGLSRLDPVNGEVRNFRASHGLQGDEFNFGAHFKRRNGELVFGGPNGFNAFFPDRLAVNSVPPAIVLSSVEKLNQPVMDLGPFDLLESLDLGYRDDIVTFEFAALDFAAPAQNRYAYKLEGFDQNWVQAGQRNRATYTNLAAGDYVFRVRAANNDGVWNEDGLSVAVSVAPAPWETWWAKSLYVLAAVLILLAVWRWQQNKLAREARYSRRLETKVQERTRELADRNAELAETNQRLAEASLTDPLTGLRNRRFLHEEVYRDVDLVRRRYQDEASGVHKVSSTDMVFIMVDLDHFKPINDNHGHAAGDEVLLEIRDTLRHACRSSDQLIRWGGDEFLIIARDADADEAERLAERIRDAVASKIMVLGNGQVARTTCSIGFACFPFLRAEPNRMAWEQVLQLADRAMYMAKDHRNAWVGLISTPQSIEPDVIQASIEDDPHDMAEQGKLEIRSSVPLRLKSCA